MNDNFKEMKMIEEKDTLSRECEMYQFHTPEEHEKSDKPLNNELHFYPPPPTMKDPLIPWRLEALKIAKDIAISIKGHFHETYDPELGGGGKDKFDIHLEQVFEIADANFKYILGEKRWDGK